ncbi:hypothetical protein ACFFWC_25395 [Plantactinospora siamensis]|uniref:Uncharacterized protein n=1 Tax=Plantactinospora siamensis TaxID=555372 RepID=A0ABV6NW65_9ACTN
MTRQTRSRVTPWRAGRTGRRSGPVRPATPFQAPPASPPGRGAEATGGSVRAALRGYHGFLGLADAIR